jgi:hypothetical protein
MGRFAEVVAAGVAGAVVFGFAYWGILVILQPLLDRVRILIHGPSKSVAKSVHEPVTRISIHQRPDSRSPQTRVSVVPFLEAKQVPYRRQNSIETLEARVRVELGKTLGQKFVLNVRRPSSYGTLASRRLKAELGTTPSPDFVLIGPGRRIVAEAKPYGLVVSPKHLKVGAPNFEAFLAGRVLAARATLQSTAPGQAERELLRKFAGKTAAGMVLKRQELKFSYFGLDQPSADDALLSKLVTQMPGSSM